jgi:23S rRNA pseudouridine1911/1915/1917 synthase
MIDSDIKERYTVYATKQDEGLRTDKFLSKSLPDLTRTRIQQLLELGHILIDGKPAKSPSKKVQEDQLFEITIPPSVEATPEPEDIPLNIIYEDNDVVVINKPAGMVVHPAPGNPNKTLVNALLAHCGESLSGINGVKRPGIVHRLDKGTSGLIVVAKNDIAHQALSQMLTDRSMSRIYQAVVWGVPLSSEGTIEGNIGRSPKNRKKMALVSKGGKEAITHYKTLKAYGLLASLVKCRLETGRTHQIRVHMTSLGHSLMGDPTYGRKPKKLPEELNHFLLIEWLKDRTALHAYQLKFIHPRTGKEMLFECPLPGDIRALLDVLEFQHNV